jgi:hypothetical protein
MIPKRKPRWIVVRPLAGAPRADHVQLRFGLGGGHAAMFHSKRGGITPMTV